MNKTDLENIHELILDECLAGYWIWDIPNQTERISSNFKRLLGYDPDEIPDDLSYRKSLIHKEDIVKVEKAFMSHIRSQGVIPYKNEMRFIHKSGRAMWFLCSGKVVEWSENGTPIKMVGCYIDLSNQKDVEVRLREAEAKKDLLFKSMNEGFVHGKILKDAEGKPIDWIFLEVNNAFERITGIQSGNLLGRRMTQVLKDLPDLFDSWLHMFSHVASAENEQDQNVRIDFSKVLKKWVQVSAFRPGKDEFGAIVQDISKRMTTQEKLDASLKVLESKNERLYNFAHIVSHNLRSHSSILKMLLDIYEMDDLPPEEKVTAFSQMRGLSNSFTETVRELEKIAAIETQGSLEIVNISLEEAIEEAVKTLSAEIKKQKAVVSVVGVEDKVVAANPAYLQSVLLNLLSNALKYKHPERSPDVSFEVSDQGAKTLIAVRDNGIGMDMDKVKNKLFGLHNTFHDNKDARGIGLYITKSQIKAMKGEISVETEVNKGTTFFVKLPKA